MLNLEKIPNLRELTIGDGFSLSFVTEPHKHWSYSVHLEKLVLDFRFLGTDTLDFAPCMPQLCSLKRLEVFPAAGRTTLFFCRSLIEASPQLREYRIESCYGMSSVWNTERIPLWGREVAAKAMKFEHRNLKVVEIGGYAGCLWEDKLVLALLKIGPSIERVVIDTKINYFDVDRYTRVTREREEIYCPRQSKIAQNKAKIFAKVFGSILPSRIKFSVA